MEYSLSTLCSLGRKNFCHMRILRSESPLSKADDWSLIFRPPEPGPMRQHAYFCLRLNLAHPRIIFMNSQAVEYFLFLFRTFLPSPTVERSLYFINYWLLY